MPLLVLLQDLSEVCEHTSSTTTSTKQRSFDVKYAPSVKSVWDEKGTGQRLVPGQPVLLANQT